MNRTRIPGVTSLIFLAAGSFAAAQTTSRVSLDSSGGQGDARSTSPSISADGRYVAFASFASNLVPGDTNGFADIFVRDRVAGTTVRVSLDSSGGECNGSCSRPSISDDGGYVAFESLATDLVAGDTNVRMDVFVRDVIGGVTSIASADSGGTLGNGNSWVPAISDDGRYVAFTSFASNLVPGDTNGAGDVFVYDLQLGTTTRVSVHTNGTEGNASSVSGTISGDGRYVAFLSGATNLIPGGTDGNDHVYIRDRQLGTTTRAVNCFFGFPAGCTEPFLSSDGRRVSFTTYGIDQNGELDVFVRDIPSGVTIQASNSNNVVTGNSCLSADGRYVAYRSDGELVPGDSNFIHDVFVHDLEEGVTTRVSVSSTGTQGDSPSISPAISADGSIVAFESPATNLVAGDTNSTIDAFVREWQLPPVVEMCPGDGTVHPCPCGNTGLLRRGCENSAGTGGARLRAKGTRRLSEDTFVLTSTGELPTVLSVFFQGTASVAPLNYGDGLRCIGGTLKRLYVKNASGGVVVAPTGSEPSVSARSSALGNPIPAGATRWYQVFHRDPSASFCPNPPGNTWNSSNGIQADWGF